MTEQPTPESSKSQEGESETKCFAWRSRSFKHHILAHGHTALQHHRPPSPPPPLPPALQRVHHDRNVRTPSLSKRSST